MNRLIPKDISIPRLLWLFILVAALFCWVRALELSGDLMKTANSVSIRYDSNGITGDTLERMLEEEQISFVAWSQKSIQNIEEKTLGRKLDAHLLEVAGDATLVLPPKNLLCGFLPVRGSVDACAVDAITAYALWGDVDIAGKTLMMDKREYTVTGVFSKPESTILIFSKLENDALFPYMEISLSTLISPRQQAERFIARYALPQPDLILNNRESAAILRQLALVPALLSSVILFWRFVRLVFGVPTTSMGRMGLAVSVMIGSIFVAGAIGFAPVIPEIAIPSRWSDFTFWPELAVDIVEQIRLKGGLLQPTPDLMKWQDQVVLLLYVGGALLGSSVGLCYMPHAKVKLSSSINTAVCSTSTSSFSPEYGGPD